MVQSSVVSVVSVGVGTLGSGAGVAGVGMMVLGSIAAVASLLVKIVASSFNAATRPGAMVARMGTAVGLVRAARRSSAADVIKSEAVAMGIPYWLGSHVTVSLMRSRSVSFIQHL
jgi:hypothetical protein